MGCPFQGDDKNSSNLGKSGDSGALSALDGTTELLAVPSPPGNGTDPQQQQRHGIPGAQCLRANLAYPAIMLNLLPSGLLGIVLAASLAGVLSVLASTFNSASTIFAADIYKRLRPRAGPASMVWAGRVFILIMTGLAVLWLPLLSRLSPSLYVSMQLLNAALAPPIVIVFCAALLWPRANSTGALSCLVLGHAAGILRLILGAFFPEDSDELLRAPLAARLIAGSNFLLYSAAVGALSLVTLVMTSMLTPPPPDADIRDCTHPAVLRLWDWCGSRRRRDRMRSGSRGGGARSLLQQLSLLWPRWKWHDQQQQAKPNDSDAAAESYAAAIVDGVGKSGCAQPTSGGPRIDASSSNNTTTMHDRSRGNDGAAPILVQHSARATTLPPPSVVITSSATGSNSGSTTSGTPTVASSVRQQALLRPYHSSSSSHGVTTAAGAGESGSSAETVGSASVYHWLASSPSSLVRASQPAAAAGPATASARGRGGLLSRFLPSSLSRRWTSLDDDGPRSSQSERQKQIPQRDAASLSVSVSSAAQRLDTGGMPLFQHNRPPHLMSHVRGGASASDHAAGVAGRSAALQPAYIDSVSPSSSAGDGRIVPSYRPLPLPPGHVPTGPSTATRRATITLENDSSDRSPSEGGRSVPYSQSGRVHIATATTTAAANRANRPQPPSAPRQYTSLGAPTPALQGRRPRPPLRQQQLSQSNSNPSAHVNVAVGSSSAPSAAAGSPGPTIVYMGRWGRYIESAIRHSLMGSAYQSFGASTARTSGGNGGGVGSSATDPRQVAQNDDDEPCQPTREAPSADPEQVQGSEAATECGAEATAESGAQFGSQAETAAAAGATPQFRYSSSWRDAALAGNAAAVSDMEDDEGIGLSDSGVRTAHNPRRSVAGFAATAVTDDGSGGDAEDVLPIELQPHLRYKRLDWIAHALTAVLVAAVAGCLAFVW